MKKDAYYFSHDANAHNDEKCLYIISRFGMAGYGLYWCFIEAMHEQADGRLTVKLIEGLSQSFHVDKDLLLQFYNEAITIGLFVTVGRKECCEIRTNLRKRGGKSLRLERLECALGGVLITLL